MRGMKRSHLHPMGHMVLVAIMELSSDEITKRGHTMARKVKIICDFEGIDHCVWLLWRLPYRDAESVNSGPTASVIMVNSGRNACMKYLAWATVNWRHMSSKAYLYTGS